VVDSPVRKDDVVQRLLAWLRCSTYSRGRRSKRKVSSGCAVGADALVDEADRDAGVEVGELAQAVVSVS
jgi:hypothetical protein